MEAENIRAIRIIKALLFSASIVPTFVAGAAAAARGPVSLPMFGLLLAALFLGQAGGDYLYYHFTRRHSDPRDAHTKIFAGWYPFFADTFLRGRGTLWAGAACLAFDLAVAVLLTLRFGWPVLLLAGLGGVIAIFFTPLMLRGLKEPTIFLAFGPLPMAGVFYVLAGTLSWEPVLASLPIACCVTVVAHLKGARTEVGTGASGELTVRLGLTLVVGLYLGAYASLALAAAAGLLPPATLLGLLSLPLAVGVVRAVGGGPRRVADYLWATVRSIAALMATGALMTAGYLLS